MKINNIGQEIQGIINKYLAGAYLSKESLTQKRSIVILDGLSTSVYSDTKGQLIKHDVKEALRAAMFEDPAKANSIFKQLSRAIHPDRAPRNVYDLKAHTISEYSQTFGDQWLQANLSVAKEQGEKPFPSIVEEGKPQPLTPDESWSEAETREFKWFHNYGNNRALFIYFSTVNTTHFLSPKIDAVKAVEEIIRLQAENDLMSTAVPGLKILYDVKVFGHPKYKDMDRYKKLAVLPKTIFWVSHITKEILSIPLDIITGLSSAALNLFLSKIPGSKWYDNKKPSKWTKLRNSYYPMLDNWYHLIVQRFMLVLLNPIPRNSHWLKQTLAAVTYPLRVTVAFCVSSALAVITAIATAYKMIAEIINNAILHALNSPIDIPLLIITTVKATVNAMVRGVSATAKIIPQLPTKAQSFKKQLFTKVKDSLRSLLSNDKAMAEKKAAMTNNKTANYEPSSQADIIKNMSTDELEIRNLTQTRKSLLKAILPNNPDKLETWVEHFEERAQQGTNSDKTGHRLTFVEKLTDQVAALKDLTEAHSPRSSKRGLDQFLKTSAPHINC